MVQINGLISFVKNLPSIFFLHLNATNCITHHPVLGLAGLFFACITLTPVIYHFHGPFHMEAAIARGKKSYLDHIRWCMQFLLVRFSTYNVVHSAYMKNLLLTEFSTETKKILIEKLAVNTQWFQEPATQDKSFFFNHLKCKKKQKILLLNRRLTARTGVIEFITLFKKNYNRIGKEWLLIVTGKGELEDKVAALSSKEVVYLGFLRKDELVKAYQSANVTILPSISLEGFGLVILESILCGTPVVVSSASGGAADFILKNAPRLIYYPYSAVSLAKALDTAFVMKKNKTRAFVKLQNVAKKYEKTNVFQKYGKRFKLY